MKDPLNIRVSAVLVLCAIDGLGKYLDVTEAQMEEVWHIERHTLESRPPTRDQEEHEQRRNELNDLDNIYETELYPAMRYSFIVLMHTFAETKLRSFCSEIQSDRQIPISVADLKGSAIDQIRTFLTKLAGVRVKDFPEQEWNNLRTLQKIRNCIVHAYGRLKDSGDQRFLRRLASTSTEVSINYGGRLVIEKQYCEQQLRNLRSLFQHLFEAVGWA